MQVKNTEKSGAVTLVSHGMLFAVCTEGRMKEAAGDRLYCNSAT